MGIIRGSYGNMGRDSEGKGREDIPCFEQSGFKLLCRDSRPARLHAKEGNERKRDLG